MKIRTAMKKFLAVACASAMVLSLAACGGAKEEAAPEEEVAVEEEAAEEAAEEEAAPAGDVTLKFQQWWGVELPDGALAEICQGFTDETGIAIELLSNPYADTKTQIAAGAAAGTMADVVGLDGSWVYDFAKQGSIANLTALMTDASYDDSQLSSQIQFEGNTYMIPVVNFAYPMYVNMDILEAAGVTEIPTTREAFLEACAAVKAYDSSIAGFAIPLSSESPSGIQNQVMTWLWADGSSMLADGKPAVEGNEKLAAVVDFIKELNDEGYLASGAYSMKESDMVEEFTNGRVAFMIDGVSHLNLIKEGAPELNFQYASVPVSDGYTGETGMDVANWGIGIAENCEYKAEAWQFVQYLMSPEVNAKLAQLANAFPGNSTADPDYSANDPLFVSAYEIFQGCFAINEFTGIPTSEDLMRSFGEQLILYLDGDTASVDEMLTNVQAAWAPAFE